MAASDGRRLTVMVALTRRVGQNHLHAAVGGVVRPLAFFAEHVADAVGVGFVKLRRTDGGEDDGGEEREKDKDGLKTGAGVYHASRDRALFCGEI